MSETITQLSPFATNHVLSPAQGGTGLALKESTINQGDLIGGVADNLLGLISLLQAGDIVIDTSVPGQITIGTSGAPPVGVLLAANNLDDVDDIQTSRDNLNLQDMALQDPANVAITGGTIIGTTELKTRANPMILSNTANPTIATIFGGQGIVISSTSGQGGNVEIDFALNNVPHTFILGGNNALWLGSNSGPIDFQLVSGGVTVLRMASGVLTVTGAANITGNTTADVFLPGVIQTLNPTIAGAGQIADNVEFLVLQNTSGGAVTGYALTLPANPVDGQPLEIAYTAPVTTSTLTASTLVASPAQTVNGGQASTALALGFGAAGGPYGMRLRYTAANSMWNVISQR